MEKRHFDDELAHLKHHLTRMSAIVETMIADAFRYLLHRDDSALVPLGEREEQVDAMQKETDELCTRLIALFQPAAADLRFILGAIKTNVDLERLADHAMNISHKAERLGAERSIEDARLVEMADLARGMVKDSLHAFVNRDVERAAEVIRRDARVNELKRTLTAAAAEQVVGKPDAVLRTLDLLLTVRNVERMGDHAKNIAENTVYVAQGKDIRHTDG